MSHEVVGLAGRARGGGARAAAHPDRRPLLHGARRHAHSAPLVREWLAGPRLAQEAGDAVHRLLAVGQALAEALEFGGHVARAQDRQDAPVAQVVEHREILGEAHRVVERRDQRGDHDAHALGAGGDRCGHHQRRRQVAVGRAVVLGQRDHREAEAVGPGALVERGTVQRGLGHRAARGGAQIVAQCEQRHLRTA